MSDAEGGVCTRLARHLHGSSSEWLGVPRWAYSARCRGGDRVEFGVLGEKFGILGGGAMVSRCARLPADVLAECLGVRGVYVARLY